MVVGADAEHLDPARLDELADRADQPLPVQLPLVAVAGRKGEQRRSPVPEDRDAHVVPQPRRIPVVVFDAHWVNYDGTRTRDSALGAGLMAPNLDSPEPPVPESVVPMITVFPGPHSARPGLAPVCSPSFSTCVPLTKTWRMPTAYWCGFSNVARVGDACAGRRRRRRRTCPRGGSRVPRARGWWPAGRSGAAPLPASGITFSSRTYLPSSRAKLP